MDQTLQTSLVPLLVTDTGSVPRGGPGRVPNVSGPQCPDPPFQRHVRPSQRWKNSPLSSKSSLGRKCRSHTTDCRLSLRKEEAPRPVGSAPGKSDAGPGRRGCSVDGSNTVSDTTASSKKWRFFLMHVQEPRLASCPSLMAAALPLSRVLDTDESPLIDQGDPITGLTDQDSPLHLLFLVQATGDMVGVPMAPDGSPGVITSDQECSSPTGGEGSDSGSECPAQCACSTGGTDG